MASYKSLSSNRQYLTLHKHVVHINAPTANIIKSEEIIPFSLKMTGNTTIDDPIIVFAVAIQLLQEGFFP